MTKEQLYCDILNHVNEGIYVVDQDRRIVHWNQAAEQITGYTANEVVGSHCQNDILRHIDQKGKPICLMGCPLFATLQDHKTRVEQVFLRHKDGFRIAVTSRIFPIVEDDTAVAAIEVFTPISNKIYNDELVSSVATSEMTDEMTKLPNRRHMQDMLEHKIRQSQRFGMQFCVIFVDIDDMKAVHTQFGAETGKVVLCNIGSLVAKQLRRTDLFGRWGETQFVGIFAISAPDEPYSISEKIRSNTAEFPHTSVEGDLVQVTVSIGATNIHPDDDLHSVINRACKLMQGSKAAGKNQTTFEV